MTGSRHYGTHPVKSLHHKVVGIVVLCIAVLASVHAEFSDDQFPQQPDILARLISAAQVSGDPLASDVQDGFAYYLRRAEYIGSCQAPFGRIHAAQFFYIRPARQGSSLPARGHAFVIFFDASFRVRASWSLDKPLSGFTFDGTKFSLGEKTLFDFASLPKTGTVAIDGKPQIVPAWTPSTK